MNYYSLADGDAAISVETVRSVSGGGPVKRYVEGDFIHNKQLYMIRRASSEEKTTRERRTSEADDDKLHILSERSSYENIPGEFTLFYVICILIQHQESA